MFRPIRDSEIPNKSEISIPLVSTNKAETDKVITFIKDKFVESKTTQEGKEGQE